MWKKNVMSNGASIGTFFSFLLIAHISWTSLDPLQLYISPCSLSTSPPLLPPASIPVPVYSNKKQTQTRKWPPLLHPQPQSSRRNHPSSASVDNESRPLPVTTPRHLSSAVPPMTASHP